MPENFEWLKASIVVLLSTIAEFCFQINVSPEVDDNVAQHPSILTTSIFFPIKKSTFNETQFLSISFFYDISLHPYARNTGSSLFAVNMLQ